jgi:hypothetical protein
VEEAYTHTHTHNEEQTHVIHTHGGSLVGKQIQTYKYMNTRTRYTSTYVGRLSEDGGEEDCMNPGREGGDTGTYKYTYMHIQTHTHTWSSQVRGQCGRDRHLIVGLADRLDRCARGRSTQQQENERTIRPGSRVATDRTARLALAGTDQ